MTNHGFITQERAGDILLKEKPSPVLNGAGPALPTPSRIVVRRSDVKNPKPSAYLSPLGVGWPASMGPSMSVQSDGDTAIIRQRPAVNFGSKDGSSGSSGPRSTVEPPCVPVQVSTVDASPFTDPFSVGDNITLSHDASGTAPITQEWYVAGVMVATTATYNFTIDISQVVNIDPVTLIGQIFVYVKTFNACGEDQTSELTFYNVQT